MQWHTTCKGPPADRQNWTLYCVYFPIPRGAHYLDTIQNILSCSYMHRIDHIQEEDMSNEHNVRLTGHAQSGIVKSLKGLYCGSTIISLCGYHSSITNSIVYNTSASNSITYCYCLSGSLYTHSTEQWYNCW